MNKPEFVFDKILLLNPVIFVMSFFVVMLVLFSGTIFFSRYIGLQLLLSVALGFGLLTFVFKLLSKKVTVSFTADSICFTINNTVHIYAKTDLKGFYSLDYEHTDNCMVVMDFHFNNGQVIYLYNYSFDAGKFDKDKHQLLQDFMKTARHELGFIPVKTSKWRTVLKTANVWFARAN